MASPLPNVPKTTFAPFVPAGYLPAPKQARFISEAEQAAAKLPPTIKPESLKNALLKGGAKPVELEYAGIDDFIAQKIAKGERVTAADAQKFIQEQGPLGQLKRVEQQATPQTPGGQNPLVTAWENKPVGAVPPSYTQNVRSPFDASTASDQTRYHEYTVPGKQGDFAGYREVLLEDPKNDKAPLIEKPAPQDRSPEAIKWMERATNRMQHLDAADFADFVDFEAAARESSALVAQARQKGMSLWYTEEGVPYFDYGNPPGPVNAHDSAYWARYNEYPDRIAVQNIQSDIGQEAVKGKGAFLEGLNRRMEEVRRSRQSLIDEINQGESTLTPSQRDEIESQIASLWSEEGEIFDSAESEGAVVFYDENGNEYFGPGNANSPLARDDNWKNLMARHIALQSLAGGGKPITIPTGKQMVDVEGFGQATHSNAEGAIKAANAYNEDLVRRLQKIFRGLDPSGAEVRQAPMLGPYTPAALYDREALHAAVGQGRRELRPPLKDNGRRMSTDEFFAGRPEGDRAVARTLKGMSMGELSDSQGALSLVDEVLAGRVSPEFQEAAMRVIQRHYLNMERGMNAPPPPDPSAPGWTITPAAKAVRAGLEKGLPILSLAPLLLAPAKQDNRR